MQYVLSLSYGKDSLACLEAIKLLGLPLDRIIHAEVWATDTIPADLPPMVEFKAKADAIIKERYGITVEHISAVERERERRLSYERQFYKERFNKKLNEKCIYGFPMVRGAWCNSRLKVDVLNSFAKSNLRETVLQENGALENRSAQDIRLSTHAQRRLVSPTERQVFSKSSLAQGADTNIVQYLGIAADEPERIKRHTRPGVILPLVEIGWDEAYCRKWCEENDLLSPIYTNAARGGCWFCHNQGVEQLRLLRRDYPDLWKILLKWDSDSPVTFKPDGRTVHDYDLRYAMEDRGLIPTDRKFRWAMLEDKALLSALKGSDEMRLISYDCEVFAYDWLVVFKDKETGQRTRIWNDNEALKMALSEDGIYVGFNSKHYDQFIIKAIAAGFTPQEIKQVNDYIIGGGQGWDCPLLKDFYFAFNNVDIKDDMQMGLSLKAIEGHLGLSVQESTVPFDIDRPLTEEERRETEFYCDHDVDTAERLIDIRKDYLKNKVQIGRLAGLSDVKAMGMTNAKLTAAMLKASKKPHDDERQYVYPENLKKEYIPPEVFAFFDKMYDLTISDKDLFSGKLDFQIGDCPGVIGYGGIHAAIPNYFFDEAESGNRVIRNKDVASYYPHLMTLCGYTSRNIPSAEVFENVLETRMKAKASGDKATANALKLVVNTTYGALLNKYNDLFDPLMGRSVCITGQLFLLELAQHLYKDIPGLKIVQLNTDGIMVECDRADLGKLDEICDEWQARTGFELEEDSVVKIAQKDVNNYVEVQPGGKAKAKGGYLVKGISTVGAFNINNSCCIVATALKEYFVNGTPVEETITNCDDIFQFQIVAKAGAKYREAYHLVDGVKEPVQKVNRVYATADERYGKLFKVKAEDDSTAKIESLPEHCIIDNDNRLTIADVDKTFYIEMALKRVNDFKGIKPERKKSTRRTKSMATATKTENVYQKLIKARAQFLNSDVQKTGKNMHLSFKYFELEDIVPTATRIFAEQGLIGVVNFTADTATMNIVNTDNPEEVITFVAPFNQIAPIMSNAGKQATNEMQALGSSITYMRRYLYMIALDICESDSIDANLGKGEAPAPAAETPKAPPATPEQRQAAAQSLTNKDGNASALQIKGLKAVLKKLKETDPSKEEMIAKIAVQTEGFTVITKSDCETLIQRITAMLEGGQDNG